MNTFDLTIYNFIFGLYSPSFTLFMRVITSFASVTVIITALMCIFILFKNKKIFLNFVSLALISKVINSIIKVIVKRPRPSDNLFQLSFESGYSFPSAHAMVATAFYGFIIYLILKYMKNTKLKKISVILLSLLIILIGISRIYLGVHYATDIIAGFILGLIILFLYVKFIYPKCSIDFNNIELNGIKDTKQKNKIEEKN